MRCFSCDMMIESGHDKATGRWYCSPCFEPTSRVILSQKQKELDSFMSQFPDSFGDAGPMDRIYLSDDPDVEEDLRLYINREDEYGEAEDDY